MRIIDYYSHLNGLEFLLVHKPSLWEEIKSVISDIDAEKCKSKVSQEKKTKGKIFYGPKDMNLHFKDLFRSKGWEENRVSYWVTKSEKLIRKTLTMSPEDQRKEILAAEEEPIYSYNQTDFVKQREIGRAHV